VDAAINWGAQELDLADDVWPGLLRHRDDVDGRVAIRFGPLGMEVFSALAAANRT